MDCIFCQIIAKERPISIVYQDELCLAFMDIHPLGRGHVLVIPNRHAQQVCELSTDETRHLFDMAQRILGAQRELGWGLEGSHILLNDGKTANQTVPHAHVHVIPREKGDTLTSMGRLILHLTGLYGLAVSRARLDEQAAMLRSRLLAGKPRRQ